ncbi:hypothetical protein Nepgr_002127 [Nepenthes gracilis]|uniref:mitogen-activated protein kinase kinase kinase n=1 Tax=Nepenthes gracilis TaxID=150966 RepID=A0AAD3RY37_NEPGR|nr:hypothetical protein Nepgr_002127 [Nepenthes gracilis]
MHLLPRILVYKKRRKTMGQTQSPKPKLSRRNASKNLDYTPTPSPLSSSSARSSTVRPTRSLDIPRSREQASFRIEGNDGDLDLACRSLGISGADVFEIPEAMWEAMKSKSQQWIASHLDPENSEEPQEHEVHSVIDDIANRFEDSVQVNEVVEAYDKISESGGSTGIRGDRPLFILTPPPSMSLPVLDSTCSTWDLVKALAPEEDQGTSLRCIEATCSSEEEEEEEEREDGDNQHVFNGVRIGETIVLSGSCSFTTSHDDDSSSTTTDVSPNGRLRVNITNWEKGRVLGQGSFGKVYEAISSEGFFFAVKEVSLIEQGSQGKQSILQLEQEIELLSQFEHENIVKYLGTDKEESKLYIFLELVTQGSLISLYQRYHLQDSQVSSYTRQILLGLKYLHDKNIVHRDIKCANILVTNSGTVKLADFGLAKATKLNDLRSCKGTAFWMAPEVVNRNNEGYGLPADIWSLGCTVLEMLTSHVPYHPFEFMTAIFHIGKGVLPPVSDSLSRDARDFVLRISYGSGQMMIKILLLKLAKQPKRINRHKPTPRQTPERKWRESDDITSTVANKGETPPESRSVLSRTLIDRRTPRIRFGF